MIYLPFEIWRDIPGWEGLYQVSTNGYLKNLNYRGTEKPRLVKTTHGPTHTHKTVWLKKNGNWNEYLLHVLVAKTFPDICGKLFNGCIVHHKNHNPLDNRPQNLIVMTNAEHARLHHTGAIRTEQTRLNISKSKIGKPAHNKGVPMSEKQRIKYVGSNNPMYGKHHSVESREKMSMKRKGLNNPRSIGVLQYSKEGLLIREWDYIKQAAMELKIQAADISRCCKGKGKTAGGYIWKYKSEV